MDAANDAAKAGVPTEIPGDIAADPLWQAISEYAFDRGGTVYKFVDRLAREQGWPRLYAEAAIGEYRRFCYLAGKADHVVVPSDAVDQVWHLHLLYSEDYWDVFCADVLGRKFHHAPSRGGATETLEMRQLYAKTLSAYAEIFTTPPPPAFWPETSERFMYSGRYRRVDMWNYVTIPRLDKPKRIGLMICAIGLIIAIITF
ncbi:MAG: hypothetical protein V3R85_06680 [Alphaproteobacteria bacterium]